MKVLGIIVNIFLPGIGTLIVGKITEGIVQIILILLSLFLGFTVIGLLIGIPLYLIVWIWSIISAATAPDPSANKTE